MPKAPAAVHITRAATVGRTACVLVSDAARVPLLLAWVRLADDGAPLLDGSADDVFVPLVDLYHADGADRSQLLSAHADTAAGFAGDPRALLGPRPGPDHLDGLADVLFDAESDLADVVDSLPAGGERAHAGRLLDQLGGAVCALDRYRGNIDDLYLRNTLLSSAAAAVDAYGTPDALWERATRLYDALVRDDDDHDLRATVVAGMDAASAELFAPAGAGGAGVHGDIDLFIGLTGFGLAAGGGIVVRRSTPHSSTVCGYVLADGEVSGVDADVLATQSGLARDECVDAGAL